MLSKKQKRLIALIAILLVAALIAANYFTSKASVAHPQQTTAAHPTPSSTATTDSADAERYMARDAGTMCEQLAPKALHAYIDDTSDRGELLARYFTPDAQGLTIPVSEIAKQPTNVFNGFLSTSDEDTAICSVTTGLSAPWILHYTYSADKGWLCDSVAGGMDGAYKTKEGKAPKASDSQA